MISGSKVRMSVTPNGRDAFNRGKKIWDDRMGYAVLQANYWKWFGFLNSVICFGLICVIGYLVSKGSVRPYIIEISESGGVKQVSPLSGNYKIKDIQINYHLAEFIKNFRGLSTDPIVVKNNWGKAFSYLIGDAKTTVSEYAKVSNLISRVGTMAVGIEIIKSVRLTDSNSFQVSWKESIYKNGGLINQETYTASMHIIIIPPKNTRVIKENPLGIYIKTIYWGKHRKEAGLGDSAK